MTDRKSDMRQVVFFIIRCVCCLTLVATFCCLNEIGVFGQETTGIPVPPKSEVLTSGAQAAEENAADQSKLTQDERIAMIEKTLESIKKTGEKSEERSYVNKMLGAQLIAYVRLMVIALIMIAIAFPVTIWMLSRKRILGLSGLSTEVAATLLVVEERQAKLTNILKEIQGEIDYLHTMSVPDLKNLIRQAENYLKQNEQDLAKTSPRKDQSQRNSTP